LKNKRRGSVGSLKELKDAAEYINKRRYGGAYDQSDSDDERDMNNNLDATPVTRRRNQDAKAVKKVQKLGNGKIYITLMKGFIGTAVLYLPNSYYGGGYGFSSLALVGSMLLTMYCSTLLLTVKATIGAKSYPDIGLKCFGPTGKLITNILLAFS